MTIRGQIGEASIVTHKPTKINLHLFILIFFLFRFFDIIKFFPANLIDKKMLNSLGVILDDIVAAIYTILTLYFINVFIQ